MKASDRYNQKRCWVDVYDGPFFKGKLRRLFGPVHIKALGGSVVVGPGARVELRGLRGKADFVMRLEPNRIVADFAKITRGGVISQAELEMVG